MDLQAWVPFLTAPTSISTEGTPSLLFPFMACVLLYHFVQSRPEDTGGQMKRHSYSGPQAAARFALVPLASLSGAKRDTSLWGLFLRRVKELYKLSQLTCALGVHNLHAYQHLLGGQRW